MFQSRDFLEKLGLGIAAQLAQSRGGDLEVESPAVGCLAFHEQRRALQAGNQRGRQVGRDGRARHTNGEVGAQMRNKVLYPCVAQRGQQATAERW